MPSWAQAQAYDKANRPKDSTYAWRITHDHLAGQYGDHTEPTRVGTAGPSNATQDQLALLEAGEGARFRMLDDDDEVYYEGRYLGDPDGDDAFGPLDDFGMPDAGATSIQYFKAGKGGGWETL